jgi:hypothetical protein
LQIVINLCFHAHTLLGPRLVSNIVDVPYTGEAALLFA